MFLCDEDQEDIWQRIFPFQSSDSKSLKNERKEKIGKLERQMQLKSIRVFNIWRDAFFQPTFQSIA